MAFCCRGNGPFLLFSDPLCQLDFLPIPVNLSHKEPNKSTLKPILTHQQRNVRSMSPKRDMYVNQRHTTAGPETSKAHSEHFLVLRKRYTGC